MPILTSSSSLPPHSHPAPNHLQNSTLKQRTQLRQFLIKEARAFGFDMVGITHPNSIPQAAQKLEQAIACGYHGTMGWMEETLDRRKNPTHLWPDVRSIIMLALNYGPDEDPRLGLKNKQCGTISVYARHRDYHELIKGRLKQLASRFAAHAAKQGDERHGVKVFVDTAPVMEKPLAAAAGLGWQGKHSNLVSRHFGSWLFLGAIFTTAQLEADLPETDHCGSCRACLDICPTSAFPAPYKLDARRCISYLTIELKEQIPLEFRAQIGNRIYGCDDCLAVCPWNKFAQKTHEIKLQARKDLKNPCLIDLLRLDDGTFRTLFSASPIKRIGRDRFIRNVLVACGNSNDKTLVTNIIPHLEAHNPHIRGMAIWALKQLLSNQNFIHLRKKYSMQEKNLDVQTEWILQ